MSKQLEWQYAHMRLGLCRHCSDYALPGAKFCHKHGMATRLRMRRATDGGVWKPGGKGRPPKYLTRREQ